MLLLEGTKCSQAVNIPIFAHKFGDQNVSMILAIAVIIYTTLIIIMRLAWASTAHCSVENDSTSYGQSAVLAWKREVKLVDMDSQSSWNT